MAITFTTRTVTAGQRDAAGEMVLRTLGDVTVTLEDMTRAELAEWEWATDTLNIGIDEEAHRLTMCGWKVVHPEVGVVGLLFQGPGTRVHVEWYDPANDDFFSAGHAAKLRHGAAQIVNARQQAGHGLPVDVTPEPVKAAAPVRPVWLAAGTQVRYHGSIEQLRGKAFRVYECECFDCDGYELHPINWYEPAAVHVGWDSVTALEAVTA
jgi:hypothetical protein